MHITRRSMLRAGAAALLVLGGLAVDIGQAQAATNPWMDASQPPSQRADELLAAMTQAEKLTMMHGGASCGYVGCVDANSRLGIPALHLQDGPVGAGDGFTGVTQLAAPVAGAASWDTALMQQYGQVLGAEQWGKGTNIVLAPTINIVRDPRWGRAFESFSEDPYLAGQIAAADIQGIQSQGPMAQVKHYAVYNQETNRNSTSDNAIVSARTEREIYTPAFETAINQGGADSAMCSYSSVNGPFACENGPLQNGILKGDLGFSGFITSDWGATHSTVNSATNGLDMEMPGSSFYGSALTNAVNSGQVSQATLNDHVHRILQAMFKQGLFDKAQTGSTGATVTTTAHVNTSRQAAEEGAVLLRNSGNILPLGAGTTSIAVIGAGASNSVMYQGGGSAGVNPSGTVTPLQGIQSRAGAGVTVTYTADASTAVTNARNANVAIVVVNKGESEGSDLSTIDLASGDNTMISNVAAANPNTIVVVNSGSAVTMPWVNSVRGVIEAWYPGQQYGNALAALLWGDVNFSGKLPVTFPQSLADVPAHTAAQWPGQNGQVQYSEGLAVGYRWYDSQNLTPLFPFGYGLSYTTFGYANLTVSTPDSAGNVNVGFDVTNTGTRAGAEVAQVYVTQPASAGEPPRNLRGFQRVQLNPGQTQHVTLTLDARSFQTWTTAWTNTGGVHTISVGSSSRDLRLTGSVTIAGSSGGGGGTQTVLPRAGWTATASVSSTTDVPSRMLDGNTATRWSTGTPMVNGQTVTVDMGAVNNIDQLTMDSAGSTNDYAHGYQVNLSTDGVNWGSPVATGAGTAALVTVTFPAQNARYIRVTQTGSSSSWWSIAEFNAYTNGSVGGGGPTLLPRTGWVASASVSSTTDVPSRMLDGNTATRWSTGTPMVNGQTVTVDMGAAHSIRQLTMDSAGSTNDYAHGYQVNLSTDGVNWGSPVATGAGTAALVTVTFPAQNARYIRVTQTGSSSSWWSIAEFNAYS